MSHDRRVSVCCNFFLGCIGALSDVLIAAPSQSLIKIVEAPLYRQKLRKIWLEATFEQTFFGKIFSRFHLLPYLLHHLT